MTDKDKIAARRARVAAVLAERSATKKRESNREALRRDTLDMFAALPGLGIDLSPELAALVRKAFPE